MATSDIDEKSKKPFVLLFLTFVIEFVSISAFTLFNWLVVIDFDVVSGVVVFASESVRKKCEVTFLSETNSLFKCLKANLFVREYVVAEAIWYKRKFVHFSAK